MTFLPQPTTVEVQIGKETMKFETGRMAKQANGSCFVTYGESVVIGTATAGSPRPGIDFFPLTVDYRERYPAAGRFPGGFFKREGRPTTKEILTMRMVDRPIRPLFPKAFKGEVQCQAFCMSADRINDPDVLAMNAIFASLAISDIPFGDCLGAVRVGRVDGELVVNPTIEQREESTIELVIAGSQSAIVMVEGSAKEEPEDVMVEALAFGHEHIKKIAATVKDLADKCGKDKMEVEEVDEPTDLINAIRDKYFDKLRKASATEGGKFARGSALKEVRNEIVAEFAPDDKVEAGEVDVKQVKNIARDLTDLAVRADVVDGRRADGRGPKDVRPIECEVGILPRTHGSAAFTRGETQALVTATLGSPADVQRVDNPSEKDIAKRFYLHYYFPPFCVGETKPIRGPGRREIGHGVLAERSLEAVYPEQEKFPYVCRIISDILESNGSSSMASVCGGTLAMMDAGVPISQPVAGIAMGMVKEGDKAIILSDILGSEDHCGDMDFKVSGTQFGITGLQMDIKIAGISQALMSEALEQAKEGRIHILKQMLKALKAPRAEVNRHAPKMVTLKIDPEKIGLLIGPGGKTIRSIQEKTETDVNVEDDGTVTVSGDNADQVDEAYDIIEAMVVPPTVGKIYTGNVVSVKDFGAFVELAPGQEGMCHISELAEGYVEKVEDIVKQGDEVKVKVIMVDESGRVKLSRKQAYEDLGETDPKAPEGKGGKGRKKEEATA